MPAVRKSIPDSHNPGSRILLMSPDTSALPWLLMLAIGFGRSWQLFALYRRSTAHSASHWSQSRSVQRPTAFVFWFPWQWKPSSQHILADSVIPLVTGKTGNGHLSYLSYSKSHKLFVCLPDVYWKPSSYSFSTCTFLCPANFLVGFWLLGLAIASFLI